MQPPAKSSKQEFDGLNEREPHIQTYRRLESYPVPRIDGHPPAYRIDPSMSYAAQSVGA